MEQIQEEKKLLRGEIRALITKEFLPRREEISRGICQNVLRYAPYQKAKTVFLFIGTSREIDTCAIVEDAWKSSKRVCVPRCIEGNRMVLCQIESMADLQSGAYGILEPLAHCPILPHNEVDFALIPCLASSRKGDRLGKGGGYYDRFLEAYRGSAAMVCPEMLLRDAIPLLPHDRQIRPVITERGIYGS